MKHILFFAAFIVSLTANAFDQIGAESRYQQYLAALESGETKSIIMVTGQDARLLLDALWETHENNRVPMNVRRTLQTISEEGLDLGDRLRLAVLRHRVRLPFDRNALGTALLMGLADPHEGERVALLIMSLRTDLRFMGLYHLVSAAKIVRPTQSTMSLAIEKPAVDQSLMARDLWNHTPDLDSFMNGKYAQGVRLYMFCRSKRDYPCLQIMRNKRHEAVRLEDGQLWSSPSLARSARDIPPNRTNGHTPTGIHTIDGVMPLADQVPSFGKFRRLILDFVPKSTNEQLQRSLLPESSQDSNWWRQQVVARDIGRSLFRIHGTGRLNTETTAPWHPFKPTSGCIAKRENTYDGVEYRDQRLLLDTIMGALDLPAVYENETEINGLLFFIELDDKAAPVTLEDLKAIGIE